MNRSQVLALHKMCAEGGTLTLPATHGPVTIEVTIRQRPNRPDRADAKLSDAPNSFVKLNDFPRQELYWELLDRLKDEYNVTEVEA
ncbi:hypothetical protein [Salinicola sp. CPA57]|uniref:hypothetical protein n=1 Tax=Salinicola sp. CPA57 TaxID=1949080 RepID=UPI000DA11F6C|nr:hypothetical protein [Salinicola sp. CPA57]